MQPVAPCRYNDCGAIALFRKPSPLNYMAETASEPWTIGRLLTWTTDYLKKSGSETPRLDAEVLLAAACQCSRIALYTSFNEPCEETSRAAFREWVKRRASGEPVAYLVGHREFYSLPFKVNRHVLIPRPETELVVVRLLDYARQRGTPGLRIADVGTGSGILAVCAAKHLPEAEVTAIDLSPEALAVARENAGTHEVADRIRFLESNLLAALPTDEQLDCVISNPPYVSEAEYAKLPPDVLEHEPRLALIGGPTGAEVIERLVQEAAGKLSPGGCLIVEFSPMIAARVKQFLETHGDYEQVEVTKDLAGHARIISAVRK